MAKKDKAPLNASESNVDEDTKKESVSSDIDPRFATYLRSILSNCEPGEALFKLQQIRGESGSTAERVRLIDAAIDSAKDSL